MTLNAHVEGSMLWHVIGSKSNQHDSGLVRHKDYHEKADGHANIKCQHLNNICDKHKQECSVHYMAVYSNVYIN